MDTCSTLAVEGLGRRPGEGSLGVEGREQKGGEGRMGRGRGRQGKKTGKGREEREWTRKGEKRKMYINYHDHINK